MKTADVAARLDSFFRLDSYGPEDFAEIKEFWREAGVPFERYVTPRFAERTNGLMLDSAAEVSRVFTLVFPSEEVLAEVERRAGGEPALIFTHHPMDFETSGADSCDLRRVARAVKEARHQLLRRTRRWTATTASRRRGAGAHRVPADATFAEYMGGHAGVYRTHRTDAPGGLRGARQAACGVSARPEGVRLRRRAVAVCAGGAAFPGLMQEALDVGCDTYVTGDFRVRHGGPWAEEHRPEFDAFVAKAPLNLIGGSHAGTEGLVLKRDMIEWFGKLGLPAEYVPQADLWR
jgi:putative NIF3 family GTP cyclohydrolase 1 type 2